MSGAPRDADSYVVDRRLAAPPETVLRVIGQALAAARHRDLEPARWFSLRVGGRVRRERFRLFVVQRRMTQDDNPRCSSKFRTPSANDTDSVDSLCI